MAQLKDSTVNGNLNVTQNLYIGPSEINVEEKIDEINHDLARKTEVLEKSIEASDIKSFLAELSSYIMNNGKDGLFNVLGSWVMTYYYQATCLKRGDQVYCMVYLGNARIYVVDYYYNQYRRIYQLNTTDIS